MEAPTTLEQYVGIALSAAQSNEAGIISLATKCTVLEENLKAFMDAHNDLVDEVRRLERKLWKKKHKKHHK